jgi:hypothetical protein
MNILREEIGAACSKAHAHILLGRTKFCQLGYGVAYGRHRDQDERLNRARAQEIEARGAGRHRHQAFGGMPTRRWSFQLAWLGTAEMVLPPHWHRPVLHLWSLVRQGRGAGTATHGAGGTPLESSYFLLPRASVTKVSTRGVKKRHLKLLGEGGRSLSYLLPHPSAIHCLVRRQLLHAHTAAVALARLQLQPSQADCPRLSCGHHRCSAVVHFQLRHIGPFLLSFRLPEQPATSQWLDRG